MESKFNVLFAMAETKIAKRAMATAERLFPTALASLSEALPTLSTLQVWQGKDICRLLADY